MGEVTIIEQIVRDAAAAAYDRAAITGRIAQIEGRLVDVEIKALKEQLPQVENAAPRWINEAFAFLGFVRSKMPPDYVAAVQAFLDGAKTGTPPAHVRKCCGCPPDKCDGNAPSSLCHFEQSRKRGGNA